MKELYRQGPASQLGPASCAGPRKEMGEALTGERVGRVLSSEIITLAADLVLACLRPHERPRATRVAFRRHGVCDPAHAGTLTSRKPVPAHRDGNFHVSLGRQRAERRGTRGIWAQASMNRTNSFVDHFRSTARSRSSSGPWQHSHSFSSYVAMLQTSHQ